MQSVLEIIINIIDIIIISNTIIITVVATIVRSITIIINVMFITINAIIIIVVIASLLINFFDIICRSVYRYCAVYVLICQKHPDLCSHPIKREHGPPFHNVDFVIVNTCACSRVNLCARLCVWRLCVRVAYVCLFVGVCVSLCVYNY